MNTSLFRSTSAWRAALLALPCAPAAAAQPGGSAWGSVLGTLAFVVLLAVLWGLLRRVQRLRNAAQRRAAPPPPQYKLDKVGNDASARPWESAVGESAPQAAPSGSVPEGFDVAAFLEAAKESYASLQRARSSADMEALRALLDEDAFAQEQAQPPQPPAGEVLTLQARLLDVKEKEGVEVASVEFSGMLGQGTSGGYAPFREVWSMTRPTEGPGAWRVAGIEPLAV